MPDAPIIFMLAGPNGAGKTTTAMTLFREILKGTQFVNADAIAQGLSGMDPDSVAIEAGAIMLRRLHALADHRANIAFETTGALRSFAAWLKTLKKNGYRVGLYFFWLPSANIARRYDLGLRNFFQLYRPLGDIWEMIDNSRYNDPHRIAMGAGLSELKVENDTIWNELIARYSR